MSTLKEFRREKDNFFAYHSRSPLTKEQQKAFKGLAYFPENPDLCFETAIQRVANPEEVHIQTSTGETRIYRRYGKFSFEVDGQQAELTIFADSDGFFLPFVDSLAGDETYPAGRYLEPEVLENGDFLIDFNMAYNPYCAYNERWSCPLTPQENRLKVPIRAGEKNFH